MHRISDLPIKHKLTLIGLLTTTVALLLACAGFVIYERVNFKQELISDISSVAEIVGYNCASTLAFNDARSAEETLRALSAKPHIVAACIYDREGRVFATYSREPQFAHFGPPPVGATEYFGNSRLDLFRPIIASGEKAGTIYLRSDFGGMRERLRRYAFIVGAVLFVAIFVAYLIGSSLQQLISAPLAHLAAVAGQVATRKDYSLRAVKRGNDELGQLIDRFNDMLAQIQLRDTNLRATHETLEQRVAERTQSLKRAQEIAELEQARFKFIFDSVPVGISLYSLRGDQISFVINDAHLKICGVSREEAGEGAIFGRISHPGDYARQRQLQQQLEAGEIDRYSLEKRYLRTDGQTVWVSFTTQRKTFSDGSRENLSTVIDITDLKRAQEEAAHEQERLKFIFESVPVGISLVIERRDHQTLRMINDAHLRICGFNSREEADIPGNFQRITHPDDRPKQADLARQLEAGEIDHFTMEKRYLRSDGNTVWVVFSAQERKYGDGTIERLTTVSDVTELKHAQVEAAREQTRFKFIFNSLPVGVAWMVCGQLDTRIANPAFFQITGIPAERCQDLALYREATHPDDRAAHSLLQARLEAGEIDEYEIEKRYRTSDDAAPKWAVLTVRYLRNPTSAEIQELSTLVDITDRKVAEAALDNIHKQLIDTSRQAGMAEVATGVLHNVGNVLNSVNVSATLVADLVRESKSVNVGKVSVLLQAHTADLGAFITQDARGRQVPGYLETLAEHLAEEHREILAELDSLRKNIEHIKDIVSMQQSYAKISGVTETIPLADLVEDALRMNAGAFVRHDVTLSRDYASRPTITVDKHKVLQILVNLMRNAKYACDESGRTDKRITVRINEEEEGRVRIALIDNGIGIAPQNLTRIFEHGFTTRKEGHGFGLHSGALAARELGGSLRAHSEGPGTGATFILDLPLIPERNDS